MIVIESSSLPSWIQEWITKAKPSLESSSHLVVIVPHGIADRNLTYRLLRLGLNPSLVEITRLEALCLEILDPGGKKQIQGLQRFMLSALIGEAIIRSRSKSLNELRSLPLGDPKTLDALMDEYLEYLRATDATELHQQLLDVATDLADSFAKRVSLLRLQAFRALETELAHGLGSKVVQSRPHLERMVRQVLDLGWPEALQGVHKVLVAGIPVFDAGTLRLLITLADRGSMESPPVDLHIFVSGRTRERLVQRLKKAGAPLREEGATEPPVCADAKVILGLKEGKPQDLVAAPDRRREVLFMAKRVHQLIASGVHPSRILVAARDCGVYLPFIADVFPAYSVPYYVQTRRPFVHLNEFAFVQATLDLLAAVQKGDMLDWNLLTAPIRSGYCHPAKQQGWPLGARHFLYLEESLSILEERKGGPMTFPAWKSVVSAELKWPEPRQTFLDFLDWVEGQAFRPIRRARHFRILVRKLLSVYMFRRSTWTRVSRDPRVPKPERFNITGLHQTWHAAAIRHRLDSFEDYLEELSKREGKPTDWGMASIAFEETLGSMSYGLPMQDLSAVKVIDVGNAWFTEADHLFLLGMRAQEFPRECPQGRFIPRQLREALDNPQKGEAAYLYLRSPESDYDNEVDYLNAVLQAPTQSVTCTMPYVDERGHIQAWSPFLDHLSDKTRRIDPAEWLPSPSNGSTWTDLVKEAPPWIRWRLLCYHRYRRFPNMAPVIDSSGLQSIASTVDSSLFSSSLEPRIERYLHPPSEITVEASEPWFIDCSLTLIAGPPFRAHELDLHATCPLQFYFYQFLFRWDGKAFDRDRIPYHTRRPHWQWGILPKRLSHVYPAHDMNQTLQSFLMKWPSRQTDLSSVPYDTSFRTQLRKQLKDYELGRLEKPFMAEWSLVRQERRDRILREWSWNPGGEIHELEVGADKVSIVVPPHRVDTVRGARLAIAYVNLSNQLTRGQRIWLPNRMRYGKPVAIDVQDPLTDYRIPVLLLYHRRVGPVAGAIYVEFYQGTRRGYYHYDWIPKHKGNIGYFEELPRPFTTESLKQMLTQNDWDRRIRQLKEAIKTRAQLMTPATTITYKARVPPSCEDCVYATLCQLPRAEEL